MIKPGVDVRGLQPEILLARIIAGEIFARYGVTAIITSALDGKPARYSRGLRSRVLDCSSA